MAERAFIALGSNIEPEKYIPLAISRLATLGTLRAVSNVYQNPAIGPSAQPDYLNAAALLETNLPASEIRMLLRSIEASLGRIRSDDKYASRTIDLDLCLLGDQVLLSENLVLPDPDLLSRPHLALTMAELDPDYQHPVTGQTLQEIAKRLTPGAYIKARADVRLTTNEVQD